MIGPLDRAGVSTVDEWELRLRGTGLPAGEITFAGLAALADALQRLTDRIGRQLTGHEGPGRSPAVVERATRLRLRSTSAGSTVIHAAIGEDGVLGDGLEHRSLDRLFEVFKGIAADTAPTWVSPLVGEATVSVIDALEAVSEECEVTTPSSRNETIGFATRTASRTVWAVPAPPTLRRPDVAVSGHLDLVDLRTARFRIKDAVGNDIRLEGVLDADRAAQLVGEVVTATGEAVIGPRGQIATLIEPTVEHTLAPNWAAPRLDQADIWASGSSETAGIDEVDDDEVEAFLELVRR